MCVFYAQTKRLKWPSYLPLDVAQSIKPGVPVIVESVLGVNHF